MVVVKGGKIPAVNIAPSAFYARGSSFGGIDGTVNRTISVSGAAINEFIYVQGAFLHAQDYTKATVAGVSQYTFLKKIYDNFYIEIYYWM